MATQIFGYNFKEEAYLICPKLNPYSVDLYGFFSKILCCIQDQYLTNIKCHSYLLWLLESRSREPESLEPDLFRGSRSQYFFYKELEPVK